jgi:hypothetical protein
MCAKIIFTSYNFLEIKNCREKYFLEKEKTDGVIDHAPTALLASARY